MQNAPNRADFGLPVGDLASPQFGTPTPLAGRYGGGLDSFGANRRVEAQIRFSF